MLDNSLEYGHILVNLFDILENIFHILQALETPILFCIIVKTDFLINACYTNVYIPQHIIFAIFFET